MLFITRKAGERIVIGEDTVIEVTEVAGRTVRIGISAPRDISVYREELLERIKRSEQGDEASTEDSPPAEA